ncbi:hypothetical protein [Microbacterium invictum]|uniref:Uncharacterized protein n=1 Tax=Microbacterium invictum TaxID=515415 RepID=A0ABZ0VES9_9MICO|nr:hypothetical protein [Microbacterium invictum]WQB71342.1 hypothetical protein T9R20_05075 [Microbacterium invictum]
MQPWRPWDATDEEYAELMVIREPVPVTLEAPIRHWLEQYFAERSPYGVVNPHVVHGIETALRVRLGLTDPRPGELADDVMTRGDQFILRVVDLLISDYEPDNWGRMPQGMAILAQHMEMSSSAVQISVVDDVFRIGRRMPEGIEDAVQRAVDDSNATAGQHLAKAWLEMRALEPDASKVLREAIQAVEAAGGPIVIPKDKRPQLSKIVGALRDQKGWGLVLARRDDDHPDHQAVLVGMLETLAFAEQHRHSGHGYSETEAVGHVELAATLVGWFSAGVIVRREGG